MKIVAIILGLLLIGAGAWYFLGAPEDGTATGNPDGSSVELTETFQTKLTERAIEIQNGMMPIEGFDAFLLLGAYPGLEEADFDGVESFEGIYTFENGELSYERTENQPITSAEQTVSAEGYATLLHNVSTRLNMEVHDDASIDALIAALEA